ncbi:MULTISPECIES: RNA deprotection pyrophosphohydrolase [Metabacillus]|jgi:8-oxo-dGTP diphosphatase|uniref:7,8-dihydro-8-oxoguanine-triphosphatase n=1 Tax=Metabacillus indicus TaxID=246786 RepID=A0A084GQX0_METID|nr:MULTISPECIES: nucleoside triphosphatase YtkD [Metabacillus]KEZ49732.1 7,8-dihydro-8-oxoguanine-triphosphatase [Metabacillus indicus]KEZ51430.1 7,8-dihydro-8-oxoguanine-triphosphatase [Metabacillus indicus LMG 22858]
MFRFKDYYHNEVHLSFEEHPFSEKPKHVWVICRYGNRWLLTIHRDRGYEFPGGKVEKGENPSDAALREVKEETGASVSKLHYVGQYKVLGKEKTIIKNIYYAEIDEIIPQADYLETEGPILFETLPTDIGRNRRFSFIMKDDVLLKSMERILERFM